jgi:hypothetical protein
VPALSTSSEAPVSSSGLSRAPTDAELRTIRALMRDTERLRGLSFVAPVDVRIQDRTAMRAYVAGELDEAELARARTRYVALGLLEPELEIRALLESLMEEELIGYYDPRAKHLAVRDDVARRFGSNGPQGEDLEWRATVVHELVHALQDQHLGLDAALLRDRTTDADNAFGALVEGDATLTMLAYVADLSGVSVATLAQDRRALRSMLAGAPDTLTGALRDAPVIVREPLLFRYREGAVFVADLVRLGGFAAVDAAHRSPPESTRQIMEPLARATFEPITPLALPPMPSLGAAGFTRLDEDTLGRFELGVYLGVGSLEGRDAARAWRADRYVVVEREAQLGSAWVIALRDTRAARRVVSLAKRAQKDVCARRGIPFRAEALGSRAVILRGIPARAQGPLLEELREAFQQ